MTESKRFGVVSFVGRPNVGKSSLINRLVGQKVSIVSRRPQTTWREITGIFTGENAQLVLVDSPGLHKPRKQLLSRRANQSARGAGTGADVVCQVVDARHWTAEDRQVLDHFRDIAAPLWLIMNKVDLLDSLTQVLPRISELQTKHSWVEMVPVSAKSGYNCEHLLSTLSSAVPEGPPGYDTEMLSTLPARFLAAEIVREQIFRQMGDEIPYTSGVEVSRFEDHGDHVELDISIWCETKGQKAALIGAKGVRLKSIGSSARIQLERMFNCPVHLMQQVKVKKGWADDHRAVTQLGYGE